MKKTDLIHKLRDTQKNLKKIDTHEHIPAEKDAGSGHTDILTMLLIPYNCDSLWSAGLSRESWARIINRALPLSERFALLSPYIPLIRHTAFFKAAEKTLKLEFGETELTLASLERADRLLKEKTASPYYKACMQLRNFEKVLSFAGFDALEAYKGGPVHFVPTVSEILPRCIDDIRKIERVSGEYISDLESLKSAIGALFEKYREGGVTAIKFGSGYRRELNFRTPDRRRAEEELMSVLSLREMGDTKNNASCLTCRSYEELMNLDDFLTDFMITLARRNAFAVVFHTAMHAWNDNNPARAHAHHLTDLIQRYPDVPIVLLHAGAPFFEEAVLLSRYFSNVYLDLTWLHVISPSLTREAVRRIIELVPVNKVFAFGGDYCHLLSVSGPLDTAMENFACVFSDLIEEGVMTIEDAESILSMWYYENPKKVFKI